MLGPDAPGLSATTVVRLKDSSAASHLGRWHLLECSYDERQCLLVVMGALEDGRKQLLAVHDGFRESVALLEDLKPNCLVSGDWNKMRWPRAQ